MTIHWKQYLKHIGASARLTPQVIQRGWLGFFGFTILSHLMILGLSVLRREDPEQWGMVSQLGFFAVDLLEYLFFAAFAAHYFYAVDQENQAGPSFVERISGCFGSYLYQGFRVLGQIILFALLFIIPGLIKQVQLGAFANELITGPSGGERDPVKASQIVMRGYILPSFIVLLVSAAVELFSMLLSVEIREFSQVLVSFLVKFINTLILVFYLGTFYTIYIAQRGKKEN